MSDDVDAELHPRDDDTDAQKQIFADIRELVRTNMRDHKALRALIDRLYLSGIEHRVAGDGWDTDTKSLYARFSIPIAQDRNDKHESWYWRQWIRLHVAPLPKYYDDSTHPHLISTIARACWATEFLCLIKPDTISTPSAGIMHDLLGQGAVARFVRVPEAWRTQTEIVYDSTAKKVAKVPPPHLYPPPPDKAPAGTMEEGEAAGLAAVRQVAIDAADRNENPIPPSPPAIAPNGRPYSELYRNGFQQAVARNLKRQWDHRRGEIEGRDDAGGRAAQHVGDGKPPMGEEDIKPENFDRRGKSPSYNTGWLSVGASEYTRVYARLNAKAEEEARRREAESEKKRKVEEDARRRADALAAEAEWRRQAEADARRKSDALAAEAEQKRKVEADARRKADALAAEAEQKRKVEADARRKADALAVESEKKRKAEAEARRKSDALAAEAEQRRQAEADARRKADALAVESEKKRKAEAEAARQREAESEKKRKADQDARRKAEVAAAESEKKRKADQEARLKLERAAQQEAKRKTEADARKRDEQHRNKIKADIIAAFVKASVPRNFAELAFTLMQKNAVPHIQIIY